MTADAVGPDFRRHPARILVAIGLILTVVGSFLPWVASVDFLGNRSALSGVDRTANGVFLILGAAVMTWLVMNRTPVEARVAVVRAAPLALAVYLLGAVNWSYDDARYVVDELRSEGATVSLEPGLWIAILGGGLCVVGAVWLTALDIRRRGAWFSRGEAVRALRPTIVGPAAGSIVGALAGFVLAVRVAVSVLPVAASFFYLVLSLVGLVVGAWGGWRLGDLLGRMASGPSPRGSRRL